MKRDIKSEGDTRSPVKGDILVPTHARWWLPV